MAKVTYCKVCNKDVAKKDFSNHLATHQSLDENNPKSIFGVR